MKRSGSFSGTVRVCTNGDRRVFLATFVPGTASREMVVLWGLTVVKSDLVEVEDVILRDARSSPPAIEIAQLSQPPHSQTQFPFGCDASATIAAS